MRLLIVTCMRDEAPSIVDWVAHHRAIGVTDFLVYTNDCTDGTEALLEALAPAGVVHVGQGKLGGTKPPPQWRAMKAAWDHPLRLASDWAMHIDVDEYVCPTTGGLRDLIAGMPDAQAITLPWRLFGSAGRFAAGEGAVPARFTRAAPAAVPYPLLASFFKTLFRLDGPFDGFRVHRPAQTAPPVLFDDEGVARPDLAKDAGRILLWRGGKPPQDRRVQLNHYSLRSIEEFLVKRLRGLPNATEKALDLTYWVERNFNTVEETSMAPHLPQLEAEAARLRALPGVTDAETRGRKAHADQCAEILGTEAGVKLAGRLAMVPSAAVPPPGQVKHLLAMLQDIGRTP